MRQRGGGSRQPAARRYNAAMAADEAHNVLAVESALASLFPAMPTAADAGCASSNAPQHATAHGCLRGVECARVHERRGGLARCHICTGTGLTPATSAPGLGSPVATFAPGLGSPLPHLHRDWAHPCHICTGTGLTPATSAPGLGELKAKGALLSGRAELETYGVLHGYCAGTVRVLHQAVRHWFT
jgi:hypothetical protein